MLLFDPVYRKNIIESTFHYYTAQTMKEVTVSLYTLIVRMNHFFTCSLQNRKFMILIEDYIHFIHAKHHPKSSVTSTIWHMCTAVVSKCLFLLFEVEAYHNLMFVSGFLLSGCFRFVFTGSHRRLCKCKFDFQQETKSDFVKF